VLTDAKGAVVTRGQESTLSSYNVVASPYATLIAEQDAQKQAVNDLAQRIRLDLGVFFSRQKAQ
jgi:LPS-assembly lipoprotein